MRSVFRLQQKIASRGPRRRIRSGATHQTLKCNLICTSPRWGSCHKRQKPQAPTPQEPIRNRQMRKVANAKGLNRNTNLT